MTRMPGLGKGNGTGASSARLFTRAGYSVALVARGVDHLDKLSQELNAAGGEAAPFPVESYTPQNIKSVWDSIRAKYAAPNYRIDAAIFNVGHGVWKPFLEVTPEDVRTTLENSVEAGFAFSREAILTFKENEISESKGKRGTLIFTGATASLRGIRPQEFGKENIHVAHAIIDGVIATERLVERAPDIVQNPDRRLSPDSIAESYLHLVNQDRSSWTWELDLRPAYEKW
ncbi:putative short-chain dehydrogenase reductase sdr [Lyophyllum shimeji]|uniref:Short-chain dehydrogenase reductase sdr n=1 Tax=Lyophyllum shimeji TaxID=47721 RepID=A0A9P3URV2_LYOSH|nr:putative short-chain dehydrogenase reductase sdr [Lyophyllum shimeji]